MHNHTFEEAAHNLQQHFLQPCLDGCGMLMAFFTKHVQARGIVYPVQERRDFWKDGHDGVQSMVREQRISCALLVVGIW